LESEVEQREQELEEAQMEYAIENTSGKADTFSPQERKALKQEQMDRMQEAARQLAETEEQLMSMEGDSAKSKLHWKAAQPNVHLNFVVKWWCLYQGRTKPGLPHTPVIY
jgi:hypothetical protein